MSNAGTRVLTFDTAVIQPDVESNIRGALPPVTIRDASSFGAGGEDIALKRWNHLTALTFAKLVIPLMRFYRRKNVVTLQVALACLARNASL